MRRLRSVLIALVLTSLPVAAAAAAPRDDIVVSTQWLAQHLKDPDLVILHVGPKPAYAAAHIVGARFVSLQDISTSAHDGKGLSLELPPPEQLRRELAALGVSDRSRIVVVFGEDWFSPATRVFFTLDAAGLGARTSLLDGGLAAWTREHRPTTTAVAPERPGTLSPLHMQPRVVDAAFVSSHLKTPGYAVIDARDGAFFDGVQHGGGLLHPQKPGHIPGAHSIPFNSVAGDDLKLRSPEALAADFRKAGVKPGDTVIAYCHVGQQATAVVLAARTLGVKAELYDGSFEDWSLRGLPVENPSARR